MKIDYKKDGSGGTIRWGAEDWLAGLSRVRSSSTSVSVPASLGTGLRTCSTINPFYRPGSLVSGPLGSNLTNASAVTGALLGMTNNSTTGYAVGGDLLHEINISTNTITNSGSFPHQVSGATMYDTVLYSIGTTQYLFYSYGTASNGNVGRFDLSSTFSDTWLSAGSHTGAATLDTTNPHYMVRSKKRNVLYIFDGRAVHQFDGQAGANGTLTKNYFRVPTGYVITSCSLTENYMVIYAYRSSTGGSFYAGSAVAMYWDEVSENPTYVRELDGVYADGGFTLNGGAGCFLRNIDPFNNYTSSKNSIVLDNGSTFESVFFFDTNLTLPSKNGVQVVDNNILFNASGTIFQWGKGEVGGDRAGFIYALGGGTTSGICRNMALGSLYASSGTSTSGGLQNFVTSSLGAGSFSTMIVELPLGIGKIARVNKVALNWANYLTSGTSATVALNTIVNQTATSTTVKPNTTLPRKSHDVYMAGRTSWVPPQFEAIGVTVTYNDGAEVLREIIIDFTFVDYT